MNYGELKALVASYLHRDDLTAEIVGFVALAESRINTALRTLENEKIQAVELTVTPSIALPDDYGEMSHVVTPMTRGSRVLERVNQQRFTLNQAHLTGTGGPPHFYTVQGGTIAVTPFAGSVENPVTLTLTYFAQLVPLEDLGDEGENKVLTRWPQLYLVGALIEAYWFIEQPQQSSDALQRFVDEMNIVNTAGKAAKRAGVQAVSAG